jgi:hypothetical protein
MWRPEDFRQLQRMWREMENVRPSAEDLKGIQDVARERDKMMRPAAEELRRLQVTAGDWAKMRLPPAQLLSLRQETELVRGLLSDPGFQKAHLERGRLLSQRNSPLSHIPDAAMQASLLEAAQHFNSHEFMVRRPTIVQTTRVAQERLGPQGLAAAERISTRHTADDGSQQRAAERIKDGQTTELLEEASRLAATPEVRDIVERTDPDALEQLDEEQRTEIPTPDPHVPDRLELVEPDIYEGEDPKRTKEDWLRIHNDALLVLFPLEAALAGTLLTPAAPVTTPLAIGVGGVIAVVSFSERVIIARWED